MKPPYPELDLLDLLSRNRFFPAGRFTTSSALKKSEERRTQPMDLQKMLSDLRAQREKLSRLILAAEDYASSGPRRRGRPPKWMQQATRRGRPPGSKNKTPIALTKTAQG